MNIDQLKLYIIQKIDETDDIELLKKIEAVVNEYNAQFGSGHVNEPQTSYNVVSVEKEIVAYTVEGQPLTKEEYVKILDDAEAEIDNGDYYTTDEVLKMIASWRE